MGEALDNVLGMLNENKSYHLFEEKIDNIRREVIPYKYVLIYFIRSF